MPKQVKQQQKIPTVGQRREQAAYQFEIQAMPRFNMEVRKRLTNYRYLVHDCAVNADLKAMVVADSFSFYEYRLNKVAQRVDLVICQRHNAALPISVLELETGNLYHPAVIPPIERPQRKKRNHEEVLLFVSKLLAGIDGAYEELHAMPRRTRQRYLTLRNAYLQPKLGKPWAS